MFKPALAVEICMALLLVVVAVVRHRSAPAVSLQIAAQHTTASAAAPAATSLTTAAPTTPSPKTLAQAQASLQAPSTPAKTAPATAAKPTKNINSDTALQQAFAQANPRDTQLDQDMTDAVTALNTMNN